MCSFLHGFDFPLMNVDKKEFHTELHSPVTGEEISPAMKRLQK